MNLASARCVGMLRKIIPSSIRSVLWMSLIRDSLVDQVDIWSQAGLVWMRRFAWHSYPRVSCPNRTCWMLSGHWPLFSGHPREVYDVTQVSNKGTEFGGVAGQIQPAPHEPTPYERTVQMRQVSPDDATSTIPETEKAS